MGLIDIGIYCEGNYVSGRACFIGVSFQFNQWHFQSVKNHTGSRAIEDFPLIHGETVLLTYPGQEEGT